MSDRARERIEALGHQLSPPTNGTNAVSAASTEGAPLPIRRFAGKSVGPRLEGKVAIITGTRSQIRFCFYFYLHVLHMS